MTIQYDMSDAPEKLRELVKTVREGGEVLLSADGHVVAKIVSLEDAARRRGWGMMKGKIWMSDDFQAPLTDEELKDWGL